VTFRNPNEEFHLVVGDLSKPLGRTLYNGNSVQDLTNKTVQFCLYTADGELVQDWTAATIVSAAAGTVQYSFLETHVETAGKFYGWFRTVETGPIYATYPASHRGIPIFIHDLATDEDH
jgi:hypothetical protein